MKLTPGNKIKNIELPAIDGTIFNSENIKGRPFMLSFFRFASCPFCNMRVNELVRRFDEFGNGFTIVAIFDSPLDNLKEHAEGHHAPFPILADEKNIYYKKYGIERSLAGVFKGMFTRIPTLMKGMAKGYLPLKIKGSLTTMPADFLVDKNGTIKEAYYGKDEGDHLPFEEVRRFSLGE
ncbi:MAG TPA: AhpC/TSA family protein [Bacteroidetes bacterium]|nr:AhpC/TSA family protein [Bacteroidota bacterium]